MQRVNRLPAVPSSVLEPSSTKNQATEIALPVLSLALCLAYLLVPSLPLAVAVLLVGIVIILIRPELAVFFLAFGWIAQRQLSTYWTGVPLLLLGIMGAALRIRPAIATIQHDKPFLLFVGVSVFWCGVSLLVRPEWRSETLNRVIYMVAGVAAYALCTSQEGRRYAEIAAIFCGVAISANAILRAQDLGLVSLRSSDIVEMKINDSNYASIPIVFGAAIAMEWLVHPKTPKRTLPLLIACLGIMAWGLLTLASRGGQLSLLLVLGFWLLQLIFTRTNRRRVERLLLGLATLATVVFLSRSVVNDELLLSNQARWEDALPSGASDRTYIYHDALQYLGEKPLPVLIGGGVGFNIDALLGINVHNQLLDTLYDYGLVGLVSLLWLWVAFLINGAKPSRPDNSARDITFLPALGLGAASMALSPIWFAFFWVEVGYLAACCAAKLPRPSVPVRLKRRPL